ncbi:MAG: dihydroxy-acid dehydratase [Phycisphaeraceae bacterium]|nr:dihydroxy-acid dehydratase [Phycisphaeraceae bacterium]
MQNHGIANALTEYGDRQFSLYMRRAFAQSMGLSREALEKPVVGIINTFSDLNNCHRDVPRLVEAVKRGVWQAGGLPLEFPTISLGELFLNPSSMMFRNLMAMDVEAMIKAQPMDAVVGIGGCDKTMPAMLMGAASAGLPTVALVTGPMLSGAVGAERVGACTDCRRYWGMYRRGEVTDEGIDKVEANLVPTSGTCGVMGTASTIACVLEAMGTMLPGGAAVPQVMAERYRIAEESGKLAVAAIGSKLTLDRILTKKAFENGLRVLQAVGGSTNVVVHLMAIAGRLGIRLTLDDLERVSETTPVLVDLKPSGQGYMDDFFRSGGLPVVLRELKDLLHLDVMTITGQTLGQWLEGPYEFPGWQTIIRPRKSPLQAVGGLVVVKGNLAPHGAIVKRAAADPRLLNHTGRAVVFKNLQDMAERVDSPDLDITADDVMVLQNAGPKGAPGMPEAGCLPIPKKLKGVKDIVRISDARMSGTAFGTVVLHITPEAAVGGLLALVRDGDRITLSVDKRELTLHVDEAELAKRRAAWKAPKGPERGYEWLYHQHVQQAHLGADFDFLRHAGMGGE